MAEVEQPLSLLDAVRAQLTIDSDSDSSQTTTIRISKKKPPDKTPLDQSVSTNPSIILIESTNDHEPFPDFDENLSEALSECEHAYNQAVTAAMQAGIRIREVEPAIVAPPGQPETKRVALDRLKELLSNPQLRLSTRKRFIALTNMIIRLDHVLFRRSEKFLGPQDTAEATEIATVMLSYLHWVDNMLQDLVDTAEHIFEVLGLLMDEEVSVVVRYRRMACVAAAHLRKPRFLEQRLLSLYLDLYDEWIHNRFLHMSNRLILQEEKIDVPRLDLARHLHSIWEIMSRSIENYAIYRGTLADIRDIYFTPTMTDMPNSPEMEDCLAEEKPQRKAGEGS
ncbi:uncharacterized protein N7482_004796 [Penicillium canariense]|uniref:Uncharacterized protein n=1 Tax=Penicillium canariense TaxID=189055 RepID=A0A9W9ID49_9EURO|nr:uncharacterized protein N7482_004796 [Penicillium canariense]KAJ5169202.1 hypothetical protein N7482_004796 [Penicillium canariense]